MWAFVQIRYSIAWTSLVLLSAAAVSIACFVPWVGKLDNSNKYHQGVPSKRSFTRVIREITVRALIGNINWWTTCHFISMPYCKKYESLKTEYGNHVVESSTPYCESPLKKKTIKHWINKGAITSPFMRIAHLQIQRWHLKTLLLKCQMLFFCLEATKKPTFQRWKKQHVKTTFSLFWTKQIVLQFRLLIQAIALVVWISVFASWLDFWDTFFQSKITKCFSVK